MNEHCGDHLFQRPTGSVDKFDDLLVRSNLTRNQLLVWLGQMIDSSPSVYSAVGAYHIQGQVDPERMQSAYNVLASSNDALRTTIEIRDGVPLQIVLDQPSTRLDYVDLSNGSDPQLALQMWLTTRTRMHFDLNKCLVDSVLLKTSPEQYTIYFRWHHIIADGVSCKVGLRALLDIYHNLLSGYPALKPDIPSFASYVFFERHYRSSDQYREAERYWKTKLCGLPATGISGSSLRRKRSGKVIRITYPLGAARTTKLRAFRRYKALAGSGDLNVLIGLSTVLFAYVFRRTRSRRIGIATPYHNRRSPRFRSVIGLLMEMLVLTAEISEEETLQSLFDKVRNDLLASTARCPYALRHAQKCYDVIVNYHKYSLPVYDGHPVELDVIKLEHQQESLILQVKECGQDLVCEFDFREDLVGAAERQTIVDSFVSLLDGLLDDHGRLLDEHYGQQRVSQSDLSREELLNHDSVLQMFEREVKKKPNALAVIYEDQRMSYEELDQRANQIAWHLQSLGIGHEDLIGLFMERSLDWVVGVLGILKAGAAYLPLDPTYPSDRLVFMADDAQITLVLSHQPVKRLLPGKWADDQKPPVVYLDAAFDKSVAAVSTRPQADSLAYVIYTSGSTGQPKGVMVSNGNLVAAYKSWNNAYKLSSTPRCYIQVASTSFDVSTGDWVRSLCSGGTLVIVKQEVLLAPSEFCDVMMREGVTALECTPAFFRSVMRYLKNVRTRLDCLTLLVFGGDTCYQQDIDDARETISKHARIFNSYGVTEGTIDSTNYESLPQTRMNQLSVPIGKPMGETRIYILDADGMPVEAGAVGELYVAGPGVARGYLHRPELTAEKFLKDTFVADAEARMYRTGDLGRWLPDGNIEFLGRNDFQVKVRGFRIEPGEIEAVMLEHSGVREAVVVAREDTPGDKRLVAYYAPDDSQDFDTASLRAEDLHKHTCERLPHYMVPTAFVRLDKLPVTSNGKLDRTALPKPDSTAHAVRIYNAPVGVIEAFLVGLWGEVLKVENIGRHDNFFDLGGDSLLALHIVDRLQQTLGRVVHVSVVFDAPTIAECADLLRRNYSLSDVTFGVLRAETNDAVYSVITPATFSNFRNSVPIRRPLQPQPAEPIKKPIVFVLCPPRSGSTLLRVMLGGHSRIFAPPEVQLLNFPTMSERRAAFPARNSSLLDGAIRAVMEARSCSVLEAKEIIERYEATGKTTKEFYGDLFSWIGDRVLVDKTTTYAYDQGTLKCAELDFEEPKYVHLVRHPASMIQSFADARMEQLHFGFDHTLTSRELGEVIWTTSHQNILDFLESVPPTRQHRVDFEALVRLPEKCMRELAHFLELDFEVSMLQPYSPGSKRMTDGIYPQARMIGDIKFYDHDKIDPNRAEIGACHIGEVTSAVAHRLHLHGFVSTGARASAE